MSRRPAVLMLAPAVAAALIVGQPAPSARQARAPAVRPAPSLPEARWLEAQDAWHRGDYPEALSDLIVLMKGPDAGEFLERVALLTGELFTTTELTTSGRSGRISRNGRYASYETGPAIDPVTTIVELANDGVREIARVHASGVTFSPSGTHAVWLRPPQTPEWKAAIQRAVGADSAGATVAQRQAAAIEAAWLTARFGDLVVRDLRSAEERVVDTGSLLKSAPVFAADGQHVFFIGAEENDLTRSDVYRAGPGGPPQRTTDQAGFKGNIAVDPSGAAVLYTVTTAAPFRHPAAGAGSGRGGGPPAGPTTGVVNLASGVTRLITGAGLGMSADGRTLVWLTTAPDTFSIHKSSTLEDRVTTVRTGREPLGAPALSPDGRLVAYQRMSGIGSSTDWEIFVTDEAGRHRRLTRDIQHDVLPRFLTADTLVGLMGEPRHRRSHLYDLRTGARQRLFSNNTLRTISPEYAWLPSEDGTRLLVEADRDGDTISPEHGLYVVDLSRPITPAELVQRLERQLATESDLRQRMTSAFRPIGDLIRTVLARASPHRVYGYEKALVDFDSKFRSEPGNLDAIRYLERTYRSFGYSPELQWFGGQPGAPAAGQPASGRTANVIATLRGTENPDLLYVLSSHFDSVIGSPGADDNTSGTAALLEAARMLADTPLPATVIFASFTGEEGGLLGSREFVRLAAERKWKMAGALNNDMIGWAGESARLDNTIRFANPGIRDIQHGAALLFTNLVTYDARYYYGTDAHSFFDAWGDIFAGLGGYPILANPNYHRPTDVLETVSMQQVMEVAKVSAASMMYLASSPSRLRDVNVRATATGTEVSWAASPEAGVRSYVVAYGPPTDPYGRRVTVSTPRAELPRLSAGTRIAVKAVNSRGLEGWDWASATIR